MFCGRCQDNYEGKCEKVVCKAGFLVPAFCFEKVQQLMNRRNFVIKNNGQNLNNYRKKLEKKKNKNSFVFTFWNLFAMKINFKNLKNSFKINLKLARIIVV